MFLGDGQFQDRTAELKLRLRLWEAREVSEIIAKILGHQHSGPLRRRKREMQPHTDEQRLDGQWIDQQSHERTSGWSSAGLRRLSEKLKHSPDPAELGPRSSSHQCRMCQGGAGCLGWWKVQSSARRNKGTRAQQNRYRVARARQIGAHECSGPHRQTTRTSGRSRLLRRSRTEEASVSRT